MSMGKTIRRLRAKAEQGFTTVELVLSAMMFLMISSSIYVLFTRSQKVFVSQQQLVAAQQNARAALDYLTETISLAGSGLPTPALYTSLGASDPDNANSNRSAFSNYGTFSVANSPMDQTHLYVKGNFSRIYGGLKSSVTFPAGSSSVCSAVGSSPGFTVEPLPVGSPVGTFSTNDTFFLYDVNPGGTPPVYWAYGTLSAGSGGSSSFTMAISDCTPPGASGYTFGQGTIVYKIDTKAFRLNGDVIEVSENGQPYETLVDHVANVAFRYFDKTNKEITNCATGVAVRSLVQKVQIQITTQAVNNELQSKKPLQVTYSSTATPRNSNF